jgi:hypothetical protein
MLGTALFIEQNMNSRGNGNAERRKSIELTFEHECSASAKSVRFTNETNQTEDVTATGGFWSQLFSYYTFLAERPLLFGVIVYLLFIALGVTFFALFFNWNFGTAFYIAMGTGLNIGPCQPSFGMGPPTGVKIFTVFYLLLSSCVICGVVGFGLSTLTYTRVDFFNVDHVDITMYITDSDGIKKITFSSFFNYVWTKVKYYGGWYRNRSQTICLMIALTWLLFGVLFGMHGLGYDFITSLYWALGTASTAGFFAPECINGTSGAECDMGQVRGSMMAIFMTFGCPLYAITCGQFASSIMAYATELRQAKLLRAPIQEAEFIFAANILSESSDTLQMGEFILLELMKLGCTDQGQINRLKQKFHELDKDHKGVLNLSDLRLSGRIVSSKLADLDVAKAMARPRRRARRSSSISNIMAAFSPVSSPATTSYDNRGKRATSDVSDNSIAAAARDAMRLHAMQPSTWRRGSFSGETNDSEMSISSTTQPDHGGKKRHPSIYGYTSFAHSYASYMRRGSNASVVSAASSEGSPIHTYLQESNEKSFSYEDSNGQDIERGHFGQDCLISRSLKRQHDMQMLLKLLGHEHTPVTEMFSGANDWESLPSSRRLSTATNASIVANIVIDRIMEGSEAKEETHVRLDTNTTVGTASSLSPLTSCGSNRFDASQHMASSQTGKWHRPEFLHEIAESEAEVQVTPHPLPPVPPVEEKESRSTELPAYDVTNDAMIASSIMLSDDDDDDDTGYEHYGAAGRSGIAGIGIGDGGGGIGIGGGGGGDVGHLITTDSGSQIDSLTTDGVPDVEIPSTASIPSSSHDAFIDI